MADSQYLAFRRVEPDISGGPDELTCGQIELPVERSRAERDARKSRATMHHVEHYRPIMVRSVKDIFDRIGSHRWLPQTHSCYLWEACPLASAARAIVMVGTKQFDHDTVVDRAMMLFWRRGYGGTSIQDLEKATRLRRGSLYNAFGDKQGLFVAALKRYETTVGQERIEQLSNPDPYRAIEGFLGTLVAQMSDPSRPRGCLHTNTSLELPYAPDEVLRIIAERTAGIEGAIYVVLRRAQAEGILDAAADARALARFYLGVAKGIGVLHKVFGDASALRDIVKIAMSKWP
jgi:AcrR family transcriptional regulator